ncbi:MAG: PAS domain S-box protein [Dehalococcoidia bacterium]|nr:PAS domain S-box protein [Dehalococcoidia bacterium]
MIPEARGSKMSEDKSKKQLPIELKKLRQRVADLEAGGNKQRQVEEALRQSEEYSSTILNHSPNPMLVTNPDTSIRYVNPALEELTGYSLVEVIGQRAPYPWWIEETLDRIKTSLEAALRHGTKAKEELFQKKNGERFWVEVTATPVMVDGKMRYYLASWVDITERRRAEEALHLRAQLLNEATDSIIATDLHGNLIYMNEATCRTRGYSKEEMLNMNLKQLVPPHIASLVDKRLRRIKKEGTIVFDSEHLRQDGGVFPIETTARTVNLGDRTIILSVIRDITERKKAEEALRESEERYRALLELGERIGEAVVMLQDDERGAGMHVYASDEWSRITGYSKKELYNMSMADLIHESDREKALERHERRILGEVLPGLYEITIVRKDGTEVPVEVTYAYSSYKGKPANVGYIRDISERKKMEEQLIVTDRLASIGELASGIAHELNNPLTGIIGFSELLLNKDIPEDVREDLQVINREAKRTSQVVKNLLTFARKHETTKQLVDINQAIKSVLDLRAYEQKVHNIAIVTNFDPELPEITADIFRLQQVFVNIIINAEYFMVQSHGRGTITITTKVKGNTILASFANDGPGIKKEHLRHLFDPFFTTKEVGKGTGLGLSICHGIVTEHGGQIHTESEPGKGATFIVELPIK